MSIFVNVDFGLTDMIHMSPFYRKCYNGILWCIVLIFSFSKFSSNYIFIAGNPDCWGKDGKEKTGDEKTKGEERKKKAKDRTGMEIVWWNIIISKYWLWISLSHTTFEFENM